MSMIPPRPRRRGRALDSRTRVAVINAELRAQAEGTTLAEKLPKARARAAERETKT